MRGALTEFSGDTEVWRALPFVASSFAAVVNSTLLAASPASLAVRGGSIADGIDAFRYRSSSIDVRATGRGPSVREWTLDGRELPGTLVIPESRLRNGRNTVTIDRGVAAPGARLFSTSGALFDWQRTSDGDVVEIADAMPCELCFDAAPGSELTFKRRRDDSAVRVAATPVRGTALFRTVAPSGGAWHVLWKP